MGYLKAQGLYQLYDGSQVEPQFSGQILELDLSTVTGCLSGPKRPQDRVPLINMKTDWNVNLFYIIIIIILKELLEKPCWI